MTTWLQLARERYGVAVSISSTGRFALCSLDERGTVRSVYLLDTAEHAERARLGVGKSRVEDLKPRNCPLPRKCSESFGYE